jgi:hypothetical protein
VLRNLWNDCSTASRTDQINLLLNRRVLDREDPRGGVWNPVNPL